MLIPQTLQGILWSKSVKKLNFEKDKVYIIHQVLAFGNLEHLEWLFKTYKTKEIAKVFLEQPLKIYQPSTFNFVKNILLNLKGKVQPARYVASLPRNTRQN